MIVFADQSAGGKSPAGDPIRGTSRVCARMGLGAAEAGAYPGTIGIKTGSASRTDRGEAWDEK